MTKPRKPNQKSDATTSTHIYLLLDRSGSMESIRSDVIGGFNAFVAEQQAAGDDASVTLVQFDSQDPQELLVDAKSIRKVRPLTMATFVPRGGTPLLDATGLLLARAEERVNERKAAGKAREEIIFVTITDGQENQSREFSRKQILDRISDLTAKGWTFVFLSAAPNAYDEAHGLGYDARSVQAFAPSPAGSRAAFSSLSRAATERRHRSRSGGAFDTADFFEGTKEAEEE